ncbi:MAG: hypothetical protein IJS88_06140 [Alphaproteobacteria bacterium]|nr:hypothetical protein [Alphaproteobacteria bacterium]
MNKKYFIIAFVFALAAAAIGGGALKYSSWQKSLTTNGEPTFANTRNKMSYLGKIKITSPDNGEINLYRQDGMWRFAEAKNYFANLRQLSNLLKMINDSQIIATDEANPNLLKKHQLDKNSGILLQTYALDGTMFDQIIIGKKEKNNICYARLPQSAKYMHRISDCNLFSAQTADWMPYPLLTIPYYLLERIKTAETELYHDEIIDKIMHSKNMRLFVLAISNLDYQGIIFKEELITDESLNPKSRQIEIEMADGLEYILTIYEADDSYWLDLAMKVGNIAHKSVPEFIEKNHKYFDKWLFQLSDKQGKLLFNFRGQ